MPLAGMPVSAGVYVSPLGLKFGADCGPWPFLAGEIATFPPGLPGTVVAMAVTFTLPAAVASCAGVRPTTMTSE